MSEARGGGVPGGPTEEELRSALPREGGGREVRVGIFVLAGILGVVVALFLLTDPATLRGRYLLVTRVEDAGGIRSGDPVLMRGVNVGRINDFSMTASGRVDITMEIEGEWEIPQDSYTRLAGAGLFGGRTMEIIRGTTAEMAEPMDTIVGVGETGGVMESAEKLGRTAQEVLSQMQAMLEGGTVSSVRTSFTDLQLLIGELRRIASVQGDQLAELTASLNRSAAGVEEAAAAGPDVARLVARTDSAMAVLARTSVTLDRAVGSLEAVLGRMESGEGTLGRLSQDDSLYVSLNRAAAAIGELAEDIRLNPRRYVTIEIF